MTITHVLYRVPQSCDLRSADIRAFGVCLRLFPGASSLAINPLSTDLLFICVR